AGDPRGCGPDGDDERASGAPTGSFGRPMTPGARRLWSVSRGGIRRTMGQPHSACRLVDTLQRSPTVARAWPVASAERVQEALPGQGASVALPGGMGVVAVLAWCVGEEDRDAGGAQPV